MSIHGETEADIREERINPILQAAGWGVVPGSRIRREVICPGRIRPDGSRGTGLSCDYVLFYKGQKLATLEAKRAGISHREGVAQAKDYAGRLGTRFAYASNGLKWWGCDTASGKEGDFDLPFPSPDELWAASFTEPNLWRERFGTVDFETDGGKWEPRYYQHRAIASVLDAVAEGEKRILLTLATGTGKTSIAFQIAWKLFQAKWNLSGEPTRRPRILFLADRNILADQAYNAFSAFPPDAVARIDPDELRRRGGKPPKNASVFFTIFQTFMTGDGPPMFEDYPPDFFDFVVVDECHRGGANDESSWRDILNHFAPAVQLGMTATPKRTTNADTYGYFGDPVYVYALKEGINDGFLTPFKVRQMASTIDEYVYDGSDEVVQGEVEVGQGFSEDDFNSRFIIEERELSRVQEFMGQIDQRQKALVFCATQDHAAMVRDMINQVKTSSDPDYCHRVTANDGKVGEDHLRAFQDNDKSIPTILTTSRKLSTGVDARNVRHIVLMRPVKNMIEFKQIIGRGTRTFDGKGFFTIWDFVKAHQNFQDPDWDGEPEEPPAPPGEPRGPVDGPETPPDDPPDESEDAPREIAVVKLSNGKARQIQYIASTTYWSPEGKPISAQAFMQRLFGDLSKMIADEDELRSVWSNPDNRAKFLERLSDNGYDRERLIDIRSLVDAPDSDLFDVLSYILYEASMKTRAERAALATASGLPDDNDELRGFLSDILTAYVAKGEPELRVPKLSQFLVARYGSVGESKAKIGDVKSVRSAFEAMQRELYSS